VGAALDDRYALVVMADHGEAFGEQGVVEAAHHLGLDQRARVIVKVVEAGVPCRPVLLDPTLGLVERRRAQCAGSPLGLHLPFDEPGVAEHLDVRQETHLDGARAGTVAVGAAASV